MEPAIDYALAQLKAGSFKAEDYRAWTMMKAGGASLSPFYEFDDKISAETKAKIEALGQQIKAGELVVPINDEEPKSTFWGGTILWLTSVVIPAKSACEPAPGSIPESGPQAPPWTPAP